MTDNQIQNIINYNCPGRFTPEEFLDGRENLKSDIVVGICMFRMWCNLMMQITSAHRETGSHALDLAIDFILWSQWQKDQPDAMEMWRVVTTWPWAGVGIYFDWDRDTSNDIEEPVVGFHVDLISSENRDRPLRWLRVDGKYYYESMMDGLFYHRKPDGQYESTSLAEQINLYAQRRRTYERKHKHKK